MKPQETFCLATFHCHVYDSQRGHKALMLRWLPSERTPVANGRSCNKRRKERKGVRLQSLVVHTCGGEQCFYFIRRTKHMGVTVSTSRRRIGKMLRLELEQAQMWLALDIIRLLRGLCNMYMCDADARICNRGRSELWRFFQMFVIRTEGRVDGS